MGKFIVKCVKCEKEKTFIEGMLSHIACQSCGYHTIIFEKDSVVQCGKCNEYMRAEAGIPFKAEHCFNRNFIVFVRIFYIRDDNFCFF